MSMLSGLVEEFSRLIAGNPVEEEIHQFIFRNRPAFAMPVHGNPTYLLSGTLSKFSITPERVPDFTLAELAIPRSQLASSISFVELKRPNAKLFAGHGKMSSDLNDAWMESVESQRLLNMGHPKYSAGWSTSLMVIGELWSMILTEDISINLNDQFGGIMIFCLMRAA